MNNNYNGYQIGLGLLDRELCQVLALNPDK